MTNIAANEARAAFRLEVGRCMFPGCHERHLGLLACHEILNGADRHHAINHRELWLVLCGPHHQQIHRENWPVARELALRRLWFPHEDGRALLCQLKGRPDTFVTEQEVAEWVEKLK